MDSVGCGEDKNVQPYLCQTFKGKKLSFMKMIKYLKEYQIANILHISK